MRLRELIQSGKNRGVPVLCVAAGSGQIASAAVKGGADILMAISAGTFRQLGVGSLASYLPFGDSNQQTEVLALREILPRAQSAPVIAGLMPGRASDEIPRRIAALQARGVEGIVNWPTISFVDGQFRHFLEADGWDLASEIELLQSARSQGMIAAAFALNESDAREFAAAGIEILILNMGLTHEAELPAKRDQLQQEIRKLHRMFKAVESTGHRPLLLAFGGAVTQPEDYAQILRQIGIDGFAGGSVFERLPVHDSVTATVREFRSIGAGSVDAAAERGLGEMLGQSAVMKRLYQRIHRIAPHEVNVCIEGESGTGKELVANHLHRLSARSREPFVTVNCGAIPDTLLESELFGHEKGAFTGAHRRRLGKFELAQNGTLFLDEIADLNMHGQVAILRAIQQREITRVGGDSPIPVNVRILTASHERLEEMVQHGTFRADLYYRLNQITLSLPPLRERREDIPLLVQAALSKLQIQLDRKLQGVSSGFMERLLNYSWPGNVRELQHVIGQAALLEPGPVLKGKEIQLRPVHEPPRLNPAEEPESRRTLAERALASAQGNKSQAAAMLGITRPTLYAWLREKL